MAVGALLFGIAWMIRRSVPSEWTRFSGDFLFLLVGYSAQPFLFPHSVSVYHLGALTTAGSLSRESANSGSLAGPALWLVVIRA
jgi:hypothetical protein